MRNQVFICHSAKDKSLAKKICEKLESNGLPCWIAPRDVPVGEVYSAAIIESISCCSVMVFLFSSHANQSPHILRELERAVSNNVTIVSFRIEDVFPGASIDYFVGLTQWLDAFEGSIDDHLEHLAIAIKRLLDPSMMQEEVVLDARLRRKTFTHAKSVSTNEFEQLLSHISDLADKNEWGESIKACGQLLTKALKKLYTDMPAESLDDQLLQRINEVEGHIGQGQRSVDDFDLVEMINFYKDTELFTELRRRLTSSLHTIAQVNWDRLILGYSNAINPDHAKSVGKMDACEIMYWTKLILYDCELAGAKREVLQVPEEQRVLSTCPMCEASVVEDWNYCPSCGGPLKLVCMNCQRALAPTFRICPYCETRVKREERSENKEIQSARKEYRITCEGAYLDGVVNFRERKLLNDKRLMLGLSDAEAYEIERQCIPPNILEYTRLLEGVLVDGKIDDHEREFLTTKAKELGIDSWTTRQLEEVSLHLLGGVIENNNLE